MNEQQKSVTEDDLVEYILKVLYSNLDINEMHLEKDILSKTKIDLTDKQTEQIRELLIATNLVRSSVGFGKNGYVYLNSTGLTVMNTFGSYRAYLQATQGIQQNNVITNQPTSNSTKQQNPYEVNGDDNAH